MTLCKERSDIKTKTMQHLIKLLSRYTTKIDTSHIAKYRFLQSFLHQPALFLEDPCYTILYVKQSNSEEAEAEAEAEAEHPLYLFFIDRTRRRYLRASMPFPEIVRILLLHQFTQYHFVFLYAHLYLYKYERDLNHDLYDWIREIPMQNIQYQLLYQGEEPSFDLFYSF